MDLPDFNSRAPCEIGDRPTSDVVVRLRTLEGRDDWVYCHSSILIERSKYFADRLSENWPTCQIIDSRSCVDLNCQEPDVDHHVNVLRLFYVAMDGSTVDLWHGVKNALGILRVAVELGCPEIVSACVEYLEAVPWEESDEEEILRTIPGMGSPAEQILARLQPVNHTLIVKIFISAVQFAMSSPPQSMNDLKSSAQEQLEYMLTEDDDAPLLIADSEIKSEVAENVKKLLYEFNKLLDSVLSETKETALIGGEMELFTSNLSDLLWTCQILSKLEMMRDFVLSWMEASEKILMVVKQAGLESQFECVETKLKVIEVADKVLESIGYGSVIVPTSKRLHMVKVWLPFVRLTKHLIDSVITNSEDVVTFKFDGELWQSLESAFVSIILALPSEDQAEILTEWLSNEHVRYPDLTEAFEVWCYRSKVAKRRLAAIESIHDTRNPS